MTDSVQAHRLTTRGCYSETGRLRKVVMCPPTYFQILTPINVVQWLYYVDGLPKPEPPVMELQHSRFVGLLREYGVEVEMVPPAPDLPYQHATRDVGTVIGDTIVLSNLKVPSRKREAELTRPYLEQSGLRVIAPDEGYVEGGDVVVDNGRLWVGIGGRTDPLGADFLYRTFKNDYEVIPLHFGARYTHLDTIFGALSRGVAIVYEPAFEEQSLDKVRAAYPSIVSLNDSEQTNAGANVLPIDAETIITIAENESVNRRLRQLGFDIVTVPYAEIIKTGGSVRCDTLPLCRE